MLFRKDKAHRKTLVNDVLAGKIACGIITLQTKVASRLSQWEKRFSIKQKKVLLILFCVLGTAGLLSMLVHALGRHKLFRKVPLETIDTAPVSPPYPDTLTSFKHENPATRWHVDK